MKKYIFILLAILTGCSTPHPRDVLLGTMAAAPEQPVLETTTKPWSYLQYEGLCISTPNWDICTTIMLPSLHARLPLALELSLAKLLDTLDPEAPFMPDPPQPHTNTHSNQSRGKKTRIPPKCSPASHTLIHTLTPQTHKSHKHA